MTISILLAVIGLALCVASIIIYKGDENPETNDIVIPDILLSVGLALIVVAGFVAYASLSGGGL